MSILDDLVNKKPRETSGSGASNRFSFQVDWAFSKLIELHKAKKPYLIILDLHDDVVIADADTAPTRFDFYQVKTKTTGGPWREAQLLHRPKPKKGSKPKKGELLSILGKLYLHRLNFPASVGVLAFVSNVRCDLKFDSRVKKEPEIFFAKLITSARNKIAKRLREEHGLDSNPDCNQCLKFVVTELDVEKHDRDVQGDLSVLCGKLWPDGRFPVASLYRAIAEQLRTRSNFERLPGTVEELLAHKAISSAEVQTFFDRIAHEPRLSTLWKNALQVLTNDDVPPLQIRALERGWNRYGIEREHPSNLAVAKLQQKIRKAVRTLGEDPTLKTHMEVVDVIVAKVGKVEKAFEGNYLKGAILLEYFDESNWELSPADSEPPGEAA